MGEGGLGPAAGHGGAVEAVTLEVSEGAAGGERLNGLAAAESFPDFGRGAGIVQGDVLVAGRVILRIQRVAGAGEDGKAR